MTFLRWCGRVALALTAAAACSASPSNTQSTLSGGTTTGTDSGSGTGGAKTTTSTTGMGGGSLFDAGTGTGGSSGVCTADAQAMYLFGNANGVTTPALYKFLPKTKSLTMVGPVVCGTTANPFAMSVDRSLTAWVLFDSGQIYKVDTSTAKCSQTGFLPGQQGFTTFGMGFVADQQNSATETLFITQADASPSDNQLGSIDTTQSPPVLSLVGTYSGGGGLVGAADATGTGDGRLFGFFRTTPTQIAQIDKATAKILGVAQLPGVTIGYAWAFAFWGGTFWLFTWDGVSASGSKLQQYDPTTQMVSTVSSGIGPVIVGAGVSTCAPLTPPQ
jgi:hypothetical protein